MSTPIIDSIVYDLRSRHLPVGIYTYGENNKWIRDKPQRHGATKTSYVKYGILGRVNYAIKRVSREE